MNNKAFQKAKLALRKYLLNNKEKVVKDLEEMREKSNQNKAEKSNLLKDWESRIIGHNQHSVLTKCFDCGMMGCNMPKVTECGNCGSMSTIRYYDSETIDQILTSTAWKK
jgi:hypothetical protein